MACPQGTFRLLPHGLVAWFPMLPVRLPFYNSPLRSGFCRGWPGLQAEMPPKASARFLIISPVSPTHSRSPLTPKTHNRYLAQQCLRIPCCLDTAGIKF